MMVRRLCSALVVVVLATACGGSAPGSAPRLKLTSCIVSGIKAECGQLVVPEDPSRPAGRPIPLRVVVLPATSTPHNPDPLFYLAGGPGGAATDDIRSVAGMFYLLNLTRDIVLIDQRGTGGSNRQLCVDGDVLSSTTADAATVVAAADTCLSQIKGKVDPRFYTTPLAVDDFDRVRGALGYDKVDIYGASYGVSSGLAYIQRHGDHVRTAVLDSGTLLDAHLWELVPRAAQRSLTALLDACAVEPPCAYAFPNLPADWASMVSRLQDHPVTVTATNPATGATQPVTIDLQGAMNAVIDVFLKSPDMAAILPKIIHLGAQGSWDAAAKVIVAAQPTPEPTSGPSGPEIMSLTIRCSDEWAVVKYDAVAAIAPSSPFMKSMQGRALATAALCSRWPHATGAAGPVKSGVPVVFINGAHDPADPPENVEASASTMPNSLVVRANQFGHGQLSSDITGCVDAQATRFIQWGRPPKQTEWSCLDTIPRPPFTVD